MRSWSTALLAVLALTPSSAARLQAEPSALPARVVAVGLPGAGAVAPVGTFHPGGPFHDKPAFAASTQPGRILDPTRVLVASSSNFGAPRVAEDASEGAVLSIDPHGPVLVVPPRFATARDQAGALEGRVQLYTAQSRAFLNSVTSPRAASASYPAVSNPLGISINNAFGRVWFVNAPQGAKGIGLNTIVDPGGTPLADAPSQSAGGVFAGDITNRREQIVPGSLRSPAVANAFLGHSPDGSKRAVFAVLTGEGSLVQVHAELGIDGLAPAGTVAPIPISPPNDAQAHITRTGMIFNWVPDRILYVAEPERNAIMALILRTDDKLFRIGTRRSFMPPELNVPIDLSPATPEVANPGFAGNTTMAGGSDFYVANRGNGTIVRMRQDGTVMAVRRVLLPGGQPLGAGRLNGIAVSPDAQRIWLTINGTLPEFPDSPGALLEVPAFGPGRAAALAPPAIAPMTAGPVDVIGRGKALFTTDFSPEQGLGPLFNKRACVQCHNSPTTGGAGYDGLAVIHRVGRFDGRSFDPLIGLGGPLARFHSVSELGIPCDLAAGPPAGANLISVRNSQPLYGLGLIDAIPDEVIRAGAVARGKIHGRLNIVRDAQGRERVGRYGWKADIASLTQFVGEAFRNELGITTPTAPTDLMQSSQCGRSTPALDDDGTMVTAVAAYIASLPPPPSRLGPQHREGAALFASVGCASCHTPALPANGREVALYSDLLLHDMGPALDDRVMQGHAEGRHWRTSPLWGLAWRGRLLHDGRAISVKDAILAHDGEAADAARAFRLLDWSDQAKLMAFLLAL
jgi:mono/diheme cytochrome c family protein